jgi:hypothetical protein
MFRFHPRLTSVLRALPCACLSPALNALCSPLMAELSAQLNEYEADPKIGAIVITGSTKAFAAGADIKEMAPKDFPAAYTVRSLGLRSILARSRSFLRSPPPAQCWSSHVTVEDSGKAHSVSKSSHRPLSFNPPQPTDGMRAASPSDPDLIRIMMAG